MALGNKTYLVTITYTIDNENWDAVAWPIKAPSESAALDAADEGFDDYAVTSSLHYQQRFVSIVIL